MLGLLFRSRFNGFSIVQRTAYSARAQDGPKDMERNQAGARHSWARQHDWLLLSFVPFPVGHPEHEHCNGFSFVKKTTYIHTLSKLGKIILSSQEIIAFWEGYNVRGGKKGGSWVA